MLMPANTRALRSTLWARKGRPQSLKSSCNIHLSSLWNRSQFTFVSWQIAWRCIAQPAISTPTTTGFWLHGQEKMEFRCLFIDTQLKEEIWQSRTLPPTIEESTHAVQSMKHQKLKSTPSLWLKLFRRKLRRIWQQTAVAMLWLSVGCKITFDRTWSSRFGIDPLMQWNGELIKWRQPTATTQQSKISSRDGNTSSWCSHKIATMMACSAKLSVIAQKVCKAWLHEKLFLIIWNSFAAVDFDETSGLPDVSAFSQIGPPKNVSVEARPEGFVVSWESPDYGSDMLSLYIVRWYLEPEHSLQGKAETRSNFYTGKRRCSRRFFFLLPTFFSFLKVPEDVLDEGMLYSFQVASVSSNNYEVQSPEFEIVTPRYRVVQAITIGAVGLLILLALAGILFYTKRHLFTSTYQEDKF